MSGHSKWATTKHRKAAQDAKRSALFSKLARNITVAAKEGGDPNPDNNASLAAAIEKAKGYSMPKDKIKTAIDKAFGSGKDAANYETVVYEGYGPAGVAVLCEALTDNRNRTAADVRAAFSHSGGNLGTSGSVAFQFDRKGQIMVSKEVETGDKKNPIGPNGAAADEEEFMLAVAEAGGDDYEDAVILKWLKTFVRRFFQQQYKRSCLPDGPKVGSASLSPRGDWRMPSDAAATLWLAELESL